MKLKFFSPDKIKPHGWLRRCLEIQANGLHGNLDSVWPDVADSKWLGGSHEGWERLPYFLDGYIPLAVLLDDGEKKARAKRYVRELISCQGDNGCFYPRGDEGKDPGDIWSLFLILKVITVYADCFCDGSVESNVEKGLRFLAGHIEKAPPFDWAKARWFECLIPVLWLYRRKKGDWLLDLAKRLRELGTDYEKVSAKWNEASEEWSFDTHVVNISMALKSDAVYSELFGREPDGLAEKLLGILFEKHGTAYGHFTGDECLSGTSPSQGSELCGIVEAMYSYEWLAAVTGEAKWGDCLEKLAFNALPAALTSDMWAHQYDQQVNQIACMDFPKPVFRTNSSQANMFGLEPHFGCCTANFGQGFPKFALSAFMKRGNALAVLSPVPAEAELDGNRVVCDSEYPFRNTVRLRSERDCEALVRVPAGMKAECKGARAEAGWIKLSLTGGVPAEIRFIAAPALTDRPGGRKCLYYGNLLFALPVEEKVKMIEYTDNGVERRYPYCDYSMEPVGEWRYAFASRRFEVKELDYTEPFDRKAPPLAIGTALAPVEWELKAGYGLVASENAGRIRRGADEIKELVPYGATYLRVTEMALADKEK